VDRHNEAYCRQILLLDIPFGSGADPKGEHGSWIEAFEHDFPDSQPPEILIDDGQVLEDDFAEIFRDEEVQGV
jgi:hypothetical protein